uniref:Uncharacterized protein n=1 Tax=Prorocentrum micans TaxID=2945 RepID=A0A7S2X499_PROMC
MEPKLEPKWLRTPPLRNGMTVFFFFFFFFFSSSPIRCCRQPCLRQLEARPNCERGLTCAAHASLLAPDGDHRLSGLASRFDAHPELFLVSLLLRCPLPLLDGGHVVEARLAHDVLQAGTQAEHQQAETRESGEHAGSFQREVPLHSSGRRGPRQAGAKA